MTRLPTGIDIGTAGYNTGGPRVSNNLELVNDAVNAIANGAGAYASNVTARLQREQQTELNRLRQEEAQREFEEKQAEEIAKQDRLVGRDLSIQDLADVLPKIETGDADYVVPDGPLGPWANGLIESATVGFSDAAKHSYREYALPKVLESANKQRENLKKAADAKTIESVARVAGTAQSAEEMAEYEAVLVGAGMAPSAARAEVGVKSLKAAVDAVGAGVDPAEARKRFDMAAKYLGGLEGPERDAIAMQAVEFETKVKQVREERHQRGYDTYAILASDKTVSSTIRKSALNKLLDEDAIDARAYRTEMDAIARNDEAAIKEAQQQALVAEENEIRARASEDSRAMIRSGLGSLLRQQKVQRSDGKEITLYDTADIDAAYNSEFARIAATAPNEEVAFSEQAKLAAFGGYVPPAWQGIVTSGALSTSEANFIEAAADGKRDNLPPTALPGFSMAKKLKAQQPGLYDKIQMPERSKDLFDIAMTLQETSGLSDTDALFEAASKVARPRPPQMGDEERGVYRKQVMKYASTGGLFGLFDKPPVNAGEVAADIQRLADVYMRGGKPMQQAVEEAAKAVGRQRTNINGWSINLNNASLPEELKENLDVVSKQIITNWVGKHGEASGYDASDLTLSPSRTTGIWQLTVGANGMSVPTGDIQDRFFDTSELMDLLYLLKPAPTPADSRMKASDVAGAQREGQAAVITAANAPASIGMGEPLIAPSWQSQYERFFRK